MRKLVHATVLAGDNKEYECGNDSWDPLLRKMATGEKGPATGKKTGPTLFRGASATRKVKYEAGPLNRWLSRFIAEARHGDGTPYPPKTIQAFLAWGYWRFSRKYSGILGVWATTECGYSVE